MKEGKRKNLSNSSRGLYRFSVVSPLCSGVITPPAQHHPHLPQSSAASERIQTRADAAPKAIRQLLAARVFAREELKMAAASRSESWSRTKLSRRWPGLVAGWLAGWLFPRQQLVRVEMD